jgi:hypothetical protein
MNKVRCVSYTSEFSIRGTGLTDLQIGHEHRVVGCNSNVFGSSNQNDLVIVTTKENNKRYVVIGVLKNKLDSCDLWAREGGHIWKYNFTYIALTKIFEVTDEIKEKIKQLCKLDPQNPDPKYLFHSRFCGSRYKNVLLELVNYLRV